MSKSFYHTIISVSKIYTVRMAIIVFLFVFASCDSVVEFNAKQSSSYLVLNSIVTSNDTVAVQVNLSRFFLSNKQDFTFINDAEVELYVNDVFVGKLKSWGKGTYSSSYLPKCGDLIKLLVKTPNNGTAYAVNRIPDAIKVESSLHDSLYIETYQYDQNDYYSGYEELKVKSSFVLVDDASQHNYYQIFSKAFVFYKDNDTIKNMIKSDVVANSLYIRILTPVESGNVDVFGSAGYSSNYFKDELFNGKSYTIKFDNIIQNYYHLDSLAKYVDSIRIETTVESLSDDYYKFLLTKDKSLVNDMFAEPVQIKSNVVGGIGILGTNSSYKFSRTFTVMPTSKRKY